MVTVNKGSKLAQLYTYQILDILVELVEALSREYSQRRPGRYRLLDRDARAQLLDFKKVGIDLNYPDKESRTRFFDAFLGNQFSARSHPLLEQSKSLQWCASRYIEYCETDPENPNHCLNCVQVAAHGLLQVFTQLTIGAPVRFTRAHARTDAIFQAATKILRNASFAATFGVNEIGDDDWPKTEYNRRGGKLLRQILAIEQSVTENEGGLTEQAKLNLEHFKELQECAFHGSRTIRMVCEKKNSLESESDLVEIAVSAARWREATRRLPRKVDRRRFSKRYVAQLTGAASRERGRQQVTQRR